MALVLPGGGVKSLFQAAMLDHLYSKLGLRNSLRPVVAPSHSTNGANGNTCDKSQSENSSSPTDRSNPIHLKVHTIIGTSGGAIVGLLAALNPGQILPDVRDALSRSVFPFLDFLRYVSFIAVGAVLMAITFMVRVAKPEALLSYTGWQICPSRRARVESFVALVILLITPFSIQFLRDGDYGSVTVIEGLLYALLTLMCHLVLTGVGVSRLVVVRNLSRTPVTTILCALAITSWSFAVDHALESSDEISADYDLSWPTVYFLVGSILAMAALLNRSPRTVSDKENELHNHPIPPLLFLFGIVLVSYVAVGILQTRHVASFLELTSRFWLSLCFSSLAVSVFLVVYSLRCSGRFSKLFWHTCLPGNGLFRLSFLGALLSVSIFGSLLWAIVVSPAIYSSELAWKRFGRVVNDAKIGDLTADLVVTGSALDSSNANTPSDLYFCFTATQTGCSIPPERAWNEPDLEKWLDVVFASGVPFPIFPPHAIRVNSEQPHTPVIDGGYAHNVPMHAASLAASHRVLVVHSTPLTRVAENEVDTRFFLRLSSFVSYANRIVPFLFDRAQELDRYEARNMLVASLRPAPSGRNVARYPHMTDFTETARNLIEDVADENISVDARIGRFDHWGRPRFQNLWQVLVPENGASDAH